MKKKFKIIILVSLIAVIIGSSTMIVFSKTYSAQLGCEIDFPTTQNTKPESNTKFNFDADKLEAQIAKDSAFIYQNPKLTDYKIVSDFGFDINDYKLRDDGTRVYKSKGVGGEDKFLDIDQFGCFSYKTGVEHTSREITLTEKECYKIAKEYLEKYGLFSSIIGKTWSTSESTTTSKSEGTTKLTIGISFYPKQKDGLDIGGNSQIYVEINANGEVCYVTYYFREYEDKKTVKLISMQEALNRFKEGKAFVQMENTPSELIFENVSLAYWTQDRNLDNIVMQPVYVFSGTSITATGETKEFSVTVQANKFN